MPEIAECITIEKKLSTISTIESISFSKKFNKYLNKNNSITKSKLINAKVIRRFTYGKSIIWQLEKNNKEFFLVNQLGMSGSWFNEKEYNKNPNNIHMIISDGQTTIYYYDPRMFGNFQIIETRELKDVINAYNWGLDPLISNNKELENILLKNKNKESTIKKFLLNPKYFYGIGNYLASEILFLSKIHPEKKIKQLSPNEFSLIVKSMNKIIKTAIKHEGFSFANGYFLPDGTKGNYNKKSLIYLKDNCSTCKKSIKAIYIDSRITYVCEFCQK